MTEITKTDLFRYFREEATGEESKRINAWLGESSDNVRLYKEASVEFEILTLMDAGQEEVSVHENHDRQAPERKFWRISAAIACNVAAAVALFFIARWTSGYSLDRELSARKITVEVPAGQRMTLTLDDGTKVELNAGTTFEYPPLFRGRERNVSLDGEAVFHVARNEKMPFVVNTFAADVKVLGTEFNVYADAGEQEFSTTLIQGKVMVTSKADPEQSVTLLPDHRVSMTDGKLRVDSIEAKETTLWTGGVIDISGNDFGRLMQKLEKAYGVHIIIERETVPEYECASGKLRVSDGIVHTLDMISRLSEFEYVRDAQTDTIYIR